MGLKKEVPDWKNAGIEPSENLKSEGHKAGVKPPASLFNWFWFSVSEFLSEIKERVYTKDETYTKEEVDVSIAKKADKNLFENHTSNKNNPHSVDKIQVGLSNVDNSKQATKIEFDSHVASKTNPHSVTKVQVGLSNVDNIQQATKAEFNSHNTDTTKHITDTERINWNSKATGDHSHNFSEIKNVPSASSSISGITRLVDSVVSSDISSAATPKSVKSAYDAAKYSEAQLNTHSLDKDNPHSVTKAQVGMSNVDNVQQATKVEFTAHSTNKSNPHAVTKAQIALGNVDNVQQATKVEFTAHISNFSNPHSVTKAQVGLSNVDNSQQATKVEFNSHAMDTTKHITAVERTKWNAKQDVSTLSRNTILWSGGLMMTGEHTITPSVALDKCENGWMIRFARYNPATAVRDDAYSVYVFIQKASVSIATDLPHGGESSAFSRKLLDVTNTTIRGKDGNQNSSPTSAVYRMIAVEVKSI
ncbi:tail fiber protein [Carnobacterium maltaromaticum]|uniref:tail fiber protein n=1 Tax=Carnobacterium maltaromaticum TaxID=2751 RepID=UPI001C4E2774|nr:tail fiber protein [Carnobacterium maltaromaticum]